MKLTDVISTGLLANIPTAGAPGRLYFPTDTSGSGLDAIYRDNGDTWDKIYPSLDVVPQKPLASGGTETTVSGYKIHTFLSNGNFVVTRTGWVDVLMVAGGGGGGGGSPDNVTGGGGGGGGGVLMGTMLIEPGTYPVVIGTGGSGGPKGETGGNGGNTTFNSHTAIGGGMGRDADTATNNSNMKGGSSGGASGSGGGLAAEGLQSYSNNGVLYGYGNVGGTKNDGAAGSFAGGGGGGAGTAGAGRVPGAGKICSYSGSPVTYAAGGYGQGTSSDINGDVSAAANSGGGGNGAIKAGTHVGGAGGSGIVIIRYKV